MVHRSLSSIRTINRTYSRTYSFLVIKSIFGSCKKGVAAWARRCYFHFLHRLLFSSLSWERTKCIIPCRTNKHLFQLLIPLLCYVDRELDGHFTPSGRVLLFALPSNLPREPILCKFKVELWFICLWDRRTGLYPVHVDATLLTERFTGACSSDTFKSMRKTGAGRDRE